MKKILLTTIIGLVLTTTVQGSIFTQEECDIFNNLHNYTQTLDNNSESMAVQAALRGHAKGYERYAIERFGNVNNSLIQNIGLGKNFNYSYQNMYFNHYYFIKYLEKSGNEALQYYFTFIEGRMKTFLEENEASYNTDSIIAFNLKSTLANLKINNTYKAFETSTFLSFVFFNLDNNNEKVFSKGYSINEDKNLKEFFKLIMLKDYKKAEELMHKKPTKPKYKKDVIFQKESWAKVIQDSCLNIK